MTACETDPVHLNRLLQVQEEGVVKTKTDLDKLSQFKSEIEQTITSLQDLEKCFTKPAYIPFGPKALIPGLLIHTNEVLVRLGGSSSYFADLSTHQAVQLLQRRILQLEENISNLKKQETLISERMQYTSKFLQIKPVSADTTKSPCIGEEEEVEIREDYNSDEERAWKEKHKLARQLERHTMNQEPVKSTKRRVRFKDTDSEAFGSTESSDEANSDQPNRMIYFTHSDSVSPKPRTVINDWTTATPAEVVLLDRYPDANVSRPSPFGDIVERSCVASDAHPPNQVRTSRFRSDRNRKK